MTGFSASFTLVILMVANPGSAQNAAPQDTDSAASHATAGLPGAPLARDPIFVYNNWSAYDELSDNIPLTEQLAMKELDEILRLRRVGVRFDYYIMDAFWFDPDGGYRTWRKPNWPQAPDAWIRKSEISSENFDASRNFARGSSGRQPRTGASRPGALYL